MNYVAFARAHAMMLSFALFCDCAFGLSYKGIAHAQEAVVAAPDAEALLQAQIRNCTPKSRSFTALSANCLEANHWDKAEELLRRTIS